MGMELFDLTGRVALVTGSSRGLGMAIARGLAGAGAAIALNGRDEQRLAETVAAFRDEGHTAEGFAFDVTDAAQIDRGIGRIEDALGAIDVLVNNAGVQRRAPLVEVDADTWQEVLAVNLTGVFLVGRRVVRGMIERRRGKIINVCSLMSEVGRRTIGPYTASKGGVKMLTKAMAVEWAPHNVQVNGIGPGYFATEMNRALIEDEQFNAWITARTPAGRWGRPEELVGAAVFLASPASDFVNGQILYVDGGILAAL